MKVQQIMVTKLRRIVTGISDEGKSIILIDGDAANSKEMVSGFSRTDIWTTETTPVDNTGNEDMGARDILFPSQSGTLFTYVEIHPGYGVEEPGWHTTDTVDYVVILKGEVYFLLEEEEVLLKAGDLLVIRGTNHTWANRSSETCAIVGVMIGANPIP